MIHYSFNDIVIGSALKIEDACHSFFSWTKYAEARGELLNNVLAKVQEILIRWLHLNQNIPIETIL